MGMMWKMSGLIRLIKFIRLIAVDANLLVGWQVGVKPFINSWFQIDICAEKMYYI